uniref:General transcription and DNA repair factor IIH subunit TFB5 n=4 Tax=Percomorphaceae TaxID=1489872 RepID=A0AAQ5YSW4_AMPOC
MEVAKYAITFLTRICRIRDCWIAADCPSTLTVRYPQCSDELAQETTESIRSGSLSFASTAKFSAPVNMVNVHKGVLVECDPAMKQFLLYLDETMALGKKFILKDLDDTHLFILAEVVHTLQDRVGELMDQNSFPITQK